MRWGVMQGGGFAVGGNGQGPAGKREGATGPRNHLGQFFAIVQRFLAMGVLFFREDMLR